MALRPELDETHNHSMDYFKGGLDFNNDSKLVIYNFKMIENNVKIVVRLKRTTRRRSLLSQKGISSNSWAKNKDWHKCFQNTTRTRTSRSLMRRSPLRKILKSINQIIKITNIRSIISKVLNSLNVLIDEISFLDKKSLLY